MKSYFDGRILSFIHALRGLAILVRSEPNARIHAVATLLVLIAGLAFRISAIEWALVALAVTCVWVAESLNTGIETVVDLISPDIHPLAGKAKDVAAAGVLAAAIGAFAVAVFVFGPRIIDGFAR